VNRVGDNSIREYHSLFQEETIGFFSGKDEIA